MAGHDSLFTELALSGSSVGIATAFTNPIDVVKVRMQLARTLEVRGMWQTALSMAREEGPRAFVRGWQPAVARAVFYGSLRLGLYKPLKSTFREAGVQSKMTSEIMAGCAAGIFAGAMSNPVDLVKVRMQAREGAGARVAAVICDVYRRDGIAGFWRGTGPGMTRAAVLTASQCVSYERAKAAWKQVTGMGDGVGTYIGASMAAGVVTTTATSPVDVVKTHMYARGLKGQGMLAALASLVRELGPLILFRGWTANWARLGPQTAITFVVNEELRGLVGAQQL